jgi:ribosomal protein S18 acetylase RimI-like enzyme
MSQAIKNGGPSASAFDEVPTLRLSPPLYESAAERLVGVPDRERARAARRFVRVAPDHGIDLSKAFITVDVGRTGAPTGVREVCLPVLGAGGSAMLFISGPRNGTAPRNARRNDPEIDHIERVAVIRDACAAVGRRSGPLVAQALPEPEETWAIDALLDAGFLRVGDLAYLRAEISERPPAGVWDSDLRLVNPRDVERGSEARAMLAEALESSYIDTLDCPELCGMRSTDDVIDSHRASGQWDPELWWVLLVGGAPRGCILLSGTPGMEAIELVYLGLAPEARGRGIARRLLDLAMTRASRRGYGSMTCAVDLRNEPALRLYERAGFRAFSRRVALVRVLD